MPGDVEEASETMELLRGEGYIVVGGGIAGLAAAYMLTRKGFKVTLLAPAQSRLTASGAAAGIITTLMPPRLAELALASAEIIGEVAPESVRRMKAYWIPSGCSDIVEYNVSKRIFSEAPAPPHFSGVDSLYAGSLPVVDTGLLMAALRSEIAGRGGRIVDGEAVEVAATAVETGEGLTLHGTPIVAAGPWSRDLVQTLRRSTVVYRCQALSVRGPPAWMKNTVVIDDEIDFYIVCWERDCVVGDGSNDRVNSVDDGFNPDLDDLLDVAYRASQRLPWLLDATPSSYWAAPCIAALDAAPLAGATPDGVAVLTAFNGAGVTLAPATAELLAKSLAGEASIPGFLDASRSVKPVEPWPPEPFRLC